MARRMTGEEWAAHLKRGARGFPKAVEAAGLEAALFGKREAQKNASGSRPSVRSGALRESIQARVSVSKDSMSIRLSAGKGPSGKRVPYARIQEEGGTIRPKRGQYLAIPFGAGRTPSGIARYDSPRDVDGGYFVRTRSGALLMIDPVLGPVFLFVKQSKIPGTGYLKRALDPMGKRLRRELTRALPVALEAV